jgi:hypothetical protein
MSRFVRAGLVLASLTLAALIVLTVSTHAEAKEGKLSAEAFRAQMRMLWEDHIIWTRQYIVSAATLDEDLADIGPTAERLFRNQADIGAAVGTFYGDEAGSALTQLLTDHIAIAADAIARAKAGDQPGLDDALARWYANADDIAAFLASANPTAWPFEMMSAHMRDHLDLTLEEAVARLQGSYAGDIAAYDRIHLQILSLADMLSDGIIDAFPNRFSR